MFKDNSSIHLSTSEFFPNLNRHQKFIAQAKKNDDNTWRIHIFADFYRSIDIESTVIPFERIQEIHDEWFKHLRSHKREEL